MGLHFNSPLNVRTKTSPQLIAIRGKLTIYVHIPHLETKHVPFKNINVSWNISMRLLDTLMENHFPVFLKTIVDIWFLLDSDDMYLGKIRMYVQYLWI